MSYSPNISRFRGALLAILAASLAYAVPAAGQQRSLQASSSVLYGASASAVSDAAPALLSDALRLSNEQADEAGTYRWTGAIIGAVLAGTVTLLWTSGFNDQDSGDSPNVASSTAIAVFAGGLTGALIGGLFKKHPPDPDPATP